MGCNKVIGIIKSCMIVHIIRVESFNNSTYLVSWFLKKYGTGCEESDKVTGNKKRDTYKYYQTNFGSILFRWFGCNIASLRNSLQKSHQ